MDLVPLRTLALSLNLSAFGVSATVTIPSGIPVTTTGIWVTAPLDEARPYGTDFQRREPRRIMALPRSAVTSVPRGTLIVAPESSGGADKTWRVDGLDTSEPDLFRVIVVPA